MKAIRIQSQTLFTVWTSTKPRNNGANLKQSYAIWTQTAMVYNFISTLAPLVDIPISRKGLKPEDFSIPTREEFAKEQGADTELQQLRNWVEFKQCPSADELAALSGRIKALAQLFDQISIRDNVLVIRRHDDVERELTIVPSERVEHII